MFPSSRRGLVEIAPSPSSRLWIAIWVGLGLAVLSVALGYGAAELLYAMRRLVLEAVFPQ